MKPSVEHKSALHGRQRTLREAETAINDPPDQWAAAEAINELLKSHRHVMLGSVLVASDPTKHPDANVIRSWVTSQQLDPREFEVILWLAAGVRSEWEMIPHRTPAQHRKLFQRAARLCRDLEKTLSDTSDEMGMCSYARGGGYSLHRANVGELMTDSESAELEARCGSDGYAGWLPNMNALLLRLAEAAERLERQGPLHTQPTKRGAKRGYFVRRTGELFQSRYHAQPHEVIAALTTIALGEATDRELVAKLLA